MNLIVNLLTVNAKAISTFIGSYALIALSTQGIRPEMTVEEAVVIGVLSLFNAGLTWLIPNKKV